MAAGWAPWQRIPAFGDWNHPRDDGVGAGWVPVTPCFDFASASASAAAAAPPPAAAQQKCNNNNKRSSMPTVSRVRVPAFGEWNHHGGDGTWPAVAMTPFFDNAATPQKATPKTGRRRRGGDGFREANKLATAAAERQGHVQTTRRSKVADSGAYAAAAAARRSCFTVAKPVDDDLYGVPPDMLHGKPRKKEGLLRILRLLLGCSCMSPS